VPTTYSDETELNMHARLLAHINNLIDDVSNTRTLANDMRTAFGGLLSGSATWDAGNLADGAEEAKEVTVTGAALGDFCLASLSIDVADLVLTAQVTAADTVTCQLVNSTGGAIDLASATVRVLVFDRGVFDATISAASALMAQKT
jgi:hypothetical protein